MDKDFVLEAIASLYARVYDESFGLEAFETLLGSIQDGDPKAERDDKLTALSGELTGLLIASIEQDPRFKLAVSGETPPTSFTIELSRIRNSGESAATMRRIVAHFGKRAHRESEDKVRISTTNIALDGVFLCSAALGKGLKVECRELSLPLLEGDEKTSVQTTTTLFGVLGFSSQKAVGKWLEHLSDPVLGRMSTFLIYEGVCGQKLQIKYSHQDHYFAVVRSSLGRKTVKKIQSIEEAKKEVLGWLQGMEDC